ncbi:MAG: hypothetical protein AAGF88_05225 [Pseudomonadota bacterium]
MFDWLTDLLIGPWHLVAIYGASVAFMSALGAIVARSRATDIGMSAALFATGTILIVTFILVTWTVASVAICGREAASSNSGGSNWGLARGTCDRGIWQWYLALRDWQTGIGAGVALLGVAWAAQLAASTQRPR